MIVIPACLKSDIASYICPFVLSRQLLSGVYSVAYCEKIVNCVILLHHHAEFNDREPHFGTNISKTSKCVHMPFFRRTMYRRTHKASEVGSLFSEVGNFSFGIYRNIGVGTGV